MPIKTSAFALAISIFGITQIASATTVKQYVLKHPKHEHCREHYARKIRTIKKNRETWCVYVAPKAPATITDPPSTVTAPAAVPAPAAATPVPISTPPVETSPTETLPVKKETEKEPAKSFATHTSLEVTSHTCSEEIKERLIPYARVKPCEYNIDANTTNEYGEAPPGKKKVLLEFPDFNGSPYYEFQAEIDDSYIMSVKLTEELGVRGEVTSEACSVEISESLYFVKELSNCHHLPVTAVYYEKEPWLGSQDGPVYFEA
jgi:hypothetical protein